MNIKICSTFDIHMVDRVMRFAKFKIKSKNKSRYFYLASINGKLTLDKE